MYKYSYYRKTIKEEHKAILGLTEFKLSLKDIEYIRKDYKEKDKKNGGYKLAEMFGVSRNCISNVVKNKTYRIY